MGSPPPTVLPDLQTRLLEIIGTEMIEPEAPLTPETDLFEEGLDSMTIMQLLVRIEEEFAVAVPLSEVSRDNFASVRAIAALVASKR